MDNTLRYLLNSSRHGSSAIYRTKLAFFELRPEMTWPDRAWLFSKLLGDETTRLVASIALVLVALGLVASGLGLFFRAEWWRTATTTSTIFSSLLFFILWNGKFQALDDQGGVGVLISLAILVATRAFNWPM